MRESVSADSLIQLGGHVEIWTVYEKNGHAPTVPFDNEEAAEEHKASFPDHMQPMIHRSHLLSEAPEVYTVYEYSCLIDVKDGRVRYYREDVRQRWSLPDCPPRGDSCTLESLRFEGMPNATYQFSVKSEDKETARRNYLANLDQAVHEVVTYGYDEEDVRTPRMLLEEAV